MGQFLTLRNGTPEILNQCDSAEFVFTPVVISTATPNGDYLITSLQGTNTPRLIHQDSQGSAISLGQRTHIWKFRAKNENVYDI